MIGIVDMHCHILPGLDDGAKNWNVAWKMIQREYDQGVRRIIFTPHYRERYFEVDQRDAVRQYNQMRSLLARMNMKLRVHLGCECHSHDRMVEHLQSGECLTMAQSKYVLIEFSSAHNFPKIRNRIYELVKSDYKPIIAHIERYPCIVEDIEKVKELIELGAYIQVNADSLLGLESNRIKKFCRQLMKADWIHFIGSDTHDCVDRISNIGKCAKMVEHKMGVSYATRIFYDNPMKIVRKE
ncbi:MAG: hypothetical protein PHN80_06945 [Hespellia sp.]|nr:hypothetical protein [Hespellia sp.]